MMHLVLAELRRAWVRRPRLLLVVGFVAVTVAIVLVCPLLAESPSDYSVSSNVVATQLASFGIGLVPLLALVETVFIWGDMLRAQIPSAAVCGGVSRWRIVLAMWLVVAAVLFIDVAVFMLLLLAGNALAGGGISSMVMSSVAVSFASGWLYAIAIVALAVPIAVMRQGVTLAIVFELLIQAGAVHTLLVNTSAIAVLAPLQLGRYTLTNCASVFESQLTLSCWNFPALLGIVVYIIIGLLIAFVLFRKKELSL